MKALRCLSPRLLLALLLGCLHALAFAPGPLPVWALGPVQLLTMSGLAALTWRAPRLRSALGLGWLFGAGTFGVGFYWLFISLHVYGYMAAWLAGLAVALLALALGLLPALAVAGAWRLGAPGGLGLGGFATDTGTLPTRTATAVAPGASQSPAADAAASRATAASPATAFPSIASPSWATAGLGWRYPLAWAAAWTAAEWVRANIFTGFPWLAAGYAHVDSPLAGWAPVLGVHGVTFMAALAAAGLATWFFVRSASRRLPLVLAMLAVLGGLALTGRDWGIRPVGEPVALRLVQGNVEQSNKFDPALILGTLARHRELASRPGNLDLVVLPETAIPVFQNQLPAVLWQEWVDTARALDTTLVTGVPLLTQAPDGREIYTNSVIGFTGDAQAEDLAAARVALRYDKAHLVPFGEYVPTGFRWFVDAMVIPLGDFNRGAERQQPFAIAGQHIAFNICYEDVFGEELLPALHPGPGGEPGATILANVSNLGWFGRSWALPQHWQIARMRTLETGRPLFAATNTGITGVIDHRGRVQAALAPHTSDILDTTVQGTTGFTPYARTGNGPVLTAIAALLAALTVLAIGTRRRSRGTTVLKA